SSPQRFFTVCWGKKCNWVKNPNPPERESFYVESWRIIKPGFRKRGGILKQRRHPTVNSQNHFALSQSYSLSSLGNCKLSWLSVDRFDSCDLATGSCPELFETSSRRQNPALQGPYRLVVRGIGFFQAIANVRKMLSKSSHPFV